MDKTEEEELEEARQKILKTQEAIRQKVANAQKKANVEKQANFQPFMEPDDIPEPSEDKPSPNEEKLRVDQIDAQKGRVANTDPIGGGTAVGAVTAGQDPVARADALEKWRYMSEKYRDRRLNKAKAQEKPVAQSQTVTENLTHDFDESKFQRDYERDFVEISDEKDELEELEREKIIEHLSAADVEVAPELVIQPDLETEDDVIKPQDGKLTVADVMTKDVISVIDTMTVEQVASIFNKRKITSVPVVDYHSKELVGIITMSDIIGHLFEDGVLLSMHPETSQLEPSGLGIMAKKVSELMRKVTFSISALKSIREACTLMEERQVQQLLVTKDNKMQGIFTSFDAVRILARFDLKLD